MFIIFSDEDSTDEQELIKRLTQGQARMEQIKRMLVNQRGFIVQALKQLTESNTSNVDVRQKFAQQIKEQLSRFASVSWTIKLVLEDNLILPKLNIPLFRFN